MEYMNKDRFFKLLQDVLHGDEEHCKWLTEAFTNAWNSEPVPPPRGSGTKDRLYREIHRLQDKLTAIQSTDCECDCCTKIKSL